MKEDYNAPQLEVLGELRDVTSGIGIFDSDWIAGQSSGDVEPGSS